MNNEQYRYHIRIKGRLDGRWQDWFDDSTITQTDDGNTALNSSSVDQAALHGLFKKIRKMGLTIISVDVRSEERNHSTKNNTCIQ